jgi:hypothetical protein
VRLRPFQEQFGEEPNIAQPEALFDETCMGSESSTGDEDLKAAYS